jgi:hypothetical protein
MSAAWRASAHGRTGPSLEHVARPLRRRLRIAVGKRVAGLALPDEVRHRAAVASHLLDRLRLAKAHDGLALDAAHHERVARELREVIAHELQEIRMGDRHQPACGPGRHALGNMSFGHRVPAVANAERKPCIHEAREVGDNTSTPNRAPTAFLQASSASVHGPQRRMPELREDRERAHARGFLRARMHQQPARLRGAMSEREQRHQVGQLARCRCGWGTTGSAGDVTGSRSGPHVRVRGASINPGQLLEAFPLHPQGDQALRPGREPVSSP